MVIQCYIDDRTARILKQYSERTGRTMEELAESAISEVALTAERDLPKDERVHHGTA